MSHRHLLAAAAIALAAGPALAQGSFRQDARDAAQEARIRQGEASGSLTPMEAMKLQRGHDRIRREERLAHADGRMTPRERAHIRAMQDREDAAISRMKRDGEVR
ncbi:MAG TPA: hypothetical protein VF457_19245 [Burkholderiaceae bacterium]